MEAPVILNLKRGPIGRPQKRPTKDLFKVFLEKVNPKAPREGRPHREDPKKVNKSFIQGGPKEKVSERAGSKWRPLVGALMELQPNRAPIVVWRPPPKEAQKNVWRPLQRRSPPPRTFGTPMVLTKLHPCMTPACFETKRRRA